MTTNVNATQFNKLQLITSLNPYSEQTYSKLYRTVQAFKIYNKQ